MLENFNELSPLRKGCKTVLWIKKKKFSSGEWNCKAGTEETGTQNYTQPPEGTDRNERRGEIISRVGSPSILLSDGETEENIWYASSWKVLAGSLLHENNDCEKYKTPTWL